MTGESPRVTLPAGTAQAASLKVLRKQMCKEKGTFPVLSRPGCLPASACEVLTWCESGSAKQIAASASLCTVGYVTGEWFNEEKPKCVTTPCCRSRVRLSPWLRSRRSEVWGGEGWFGCLRRSRGAGTLACVGNPARGPRCWHEWPGGVRVAGGRDETFFCVRIICWNGKKSENNTKKRVAKKPGQLFPVKQNPDHQWENIGWVNLPQASLLGLHKLHKKKLTSFFVLIFFITHFNSGPL